MCALDLASLKQASTKKEETLLVEIDEDFLFLSLEMRTDLLGQLREISSKRTICIIENNLSLLSENSIAYTHTIKSQKILVNSCIDHPLLHGFDFKDNPADPLADAMLDYMHDILISESGKLTIDRKIIDDFIILNYLTEHIERVGHYLKLRTFKSTKADFLKQGLLTDQMQFRDDFCILSIPCSCTKNELLDTLERIKSIVMR